MSAPGLRVRTEWPSSARCRTSWGSICGVEGIVFIAGSVSDEETTKVFPGGWKAPKRYLRKRENRLVVARIAAMVQDFESIY
jgi:hypothetical protein